MCERLCMDCGSPGIDEVNPCRAERGARSQRSDDQRDAGASAVQAATRRSNGRSLCFVCAQAMSFAELMKQVQAMTYSVIVFDTAPTGHTLRLLSFPSVLEKAFEKFTAVKAKFSGLFAQVSGMVQPATEEKLMGKLEQAKATIELINEQFKNPDMTTFVCVCIPEFLSLFETERLVQELAKYEIDTHNIVVNQVLFPDELTGSSAGHSDCKKCLARRRMQAKYLEQIQSLYDDFHGQQHTPHTPHEASAAGFIPP